MLSLSEGSQRDGEETTTRQLVKPLLARAITDYKGGLIFVLASKTYLDEGEGEHP